jgi:hypothetical protein
MRGELLNQSFRKKTPHRPTINARFYLRKNNLKPEQRQAAAKSTTISIKDT